MLNIVIPMAGKGSRFANSGYKEPKPLISIYGHPMIEYVVKNITPRENHRFIFICQKDHLEKYDLGKKLKSITNNCELIPIDYVTEGAACTVLLAEKYIDNEDRLMIANSDQYVDLDINTYLAHEKYKDGLIMTMPANHPKWSYIKYDADGWVTMVREKEVISNEATVGIYNYNHGGDFVKYAYQMIQKNIRVNNEFYVAPVYNEMIEAGMKIGFYDVGESMHGIGTPEDLETFMKHPVARRAFCDNE